MNERMVTPEGLLEMLEASWPGDKRRQYLAARLLADAAKAVAEALAPHESVPGSTVLFGIPFYIQRRVRKKYLYDSSPVWRVVRNQEVAIAERRRQIEKLLQTGGIDPQTGEELDPVPFEEQAYLQVQRIEL